MPVWRLPPTQPPWQPQPQRRSSGLVLPPNNYYSTTFSLTEAPMSEGGVWLLGKTHGLDWSDINTSGGNAYGTESGNNTTGTIGVTPNQYDDSTAILAGIWGSDQSAQGTAFVTRGSGDYGSENELRLRSMVTPHSITGYEVEYSCDPANPYFDIVRWNGQVGDFTPLTLSTGGTHLASMPGGAVTSGDVLFAQIIGSTIYGYKNGVLMASATDTTFTTGNPGLGTYIHNRTATGDPTQWGFSDFTAQIVQDTPELRGRPFGYRGQSQMQQIMAA